MVDRNAFDAARDELAQRTIAVPSIARAA